MLQKDNKSLKESSPYEAVMTREQFLFYEMRTTAKLMNEGMDNATIIATILSDISPNQIKDENFASRLRVPCWAYKSGD